MNSDQRLVTVVFADEKLKEAYYSVKSSDGVSRIGRLITNIYLNKNGLKPIDITENRDLVKKVIECFNFSGYIAGTLGLIIATSIKENDKNKLIHSLIHSKTKNIYAIELRDNILFYLNAINKNLLIKDAIKLYKHGIKSDETLVQGALWLIWQSGSDNSLLDEVVSNCNGRTKTLALLIMGDINFKKYKQLIKNNIFSSDVDQSIAAISMFGKNGELDKELVKSIIKTKKEYRILCSICRSLEHSTKLEEFTDLFDVLIKSKSNSVRLRAYHALISALPDNKIINILECNFTKETPEIKKAIVGELGISGKLNDDVIAEKLIYLIDDKPTRKVLLGELSRQPKVNQTYILFLDRIMKSDNHSSSEKAYAIYLIGRERGYEFIFNRYCFKFDDKKSVIENFSLSLVHEISKNIPPKTNHLIDFNLALDISRKKTNKKSIPFENSTEFQRTVNTLIDFLKKEYCTK